VLSHFRSIVYVPHKALYFSIFVIILFLIIGLFNKPSIEFAAKIGDSTGFNERFITYLEFKEENNPVIEIFKEEVENELQNYNLLKKYKFKMKYKNLISAVLILLISFAVYFIPTPTRGESIERENVNKEIKKEIIKLDKTLSRNNEADNGLKNNELKKEAVNIIKNLERNLQKSYNTAAANVSKAQKKLQMLSNKGKSDEIKALAGLFEGISEEFNDLQKAVSEGNMEEAARIADSMQLSKNQQKALKRNLEEYLSRHKKVDFNKELKELKKQVDSEAISGEELSDTIKKLYAKKEFTDKKNDEFKLQNMKEKFIAKAENNKAIENKGGRDSLSSFTMGDVDDNSYGQESDMSEGEIKAGGAGNKKMDSPNGVGGSGKAASGRGDGEKSFGDVGKNESSQLIGENNNDISTVKGKIGEKGNVYSKSAEEIIAQNGEMKYMENKWRQFKKERMKYIEKYEVPLDEKEIVVEYFKQLNGGVFHGE
jgi:hypothetical protein